MDDEVQTAYHLISELYKSPVLDCPQWAGIKTAMARHQVRCVRMACLQHAFFSDVKPQCFLSMLNSAMDENASWTEDYLFGADEDPRCDPTLRVMYYNNRGLLHLKMRQPSIAAWCFRKALDLHVELRRQMTQDFTMELHYNLGLALQQLQQHLQAYETMNYITERVEWPSLWMRLSDCCLGMAQTIDLKKKKKSSKRIQEIRGRGRARRFLLAMDTERTAATPAVPTASTRSEPETSAEWLWLSIAALKSARQMCRGTPRDDSGSRMDDLLVVKLSYNLLLQQDYAQALSVARGLLVKYTVLSDTWSMTLAQKRTSRSSVKGPLQEVGVVRCAVHYCAECLTALNKVYEAQTLLTSFLSIQFLPLGGTKNGRMHTKYPVDLARKVKPPLSRKTQCTLEHLVTGGLDVSPWSLLPSYDTTNALCTASASITLIEAQSELYANLATVHIYNSCVLTKSSPEIISSFLDVALAMNPKNSAAQNTRLYLKMCDQKRADAMQLLKGR